MTEELNPSGWSPTPEEDEQSREAYRRLLAENGWPTEDADPLDQPPIVIRGEGCWLSGPC